MATRPTEMINIRGRSRRIWASVCWLSTAIPVSVAPGTSAIRAGTCVVAAARGSRMVSGSDRFTMMIDSFGIFPPTDFGRIVPAIWR